MGRDAAMKYSRGCFPSRALLFLILGAWNVLGASSRLWNPRRRGSSTVRGRARNLGIGDSTDMSKGKAGKGDGGKSKSKGSSKAKAGGSVSTSKTTATPSEVNVFDHTQINILSEADFVLYCYSQFLSMGATSVDLISQEYATHLIGNVCDSFQHEDVPLFQCSSPAFESLSLNVKLTLAPYMCPSEDESGGLACLSGLGIDVTDLDDKVEVERTDSITGFCCSILPFLADAELDSMEEDSSVCVSAPAPVVQPSTAIPVPPPTVVTLTSSPTEVPVSSPVPQPTVAPTSTPTKAPFQSPPTERGIAPLPSATPVSTQAPSTKPVSVVRTALPTADEFDNLMETSAAIQSTDNAMSLGGTVGIVLGGAAIAMFLLAIVSWRRSKQRGI